MKKIRITSEIPRDTIPEVTSTFSAFWNHNSCETGAEVEHLNQDNGYIPFDPNLENSLPYVDCTASVEILYDACERISKVFAPSLQVSDMTLSMVEESRDSKKCIKSYNAHMPSLTLASAEKPNRVLPVAMLQDEQCVTP